MIFEKRRRMKNLQRLASMMLLFRSAPAGAPRVGFTGIQEVAMRVLIGAALSLMSVAAQAGTIVQPVPEPGTLGLLVAAAVAGLAFGRRRRK